MMFRLLSLGRDAFSRLAGSTLLSALAATPNGAAAAALRTFSKD